MIIGKKSTKDRIFDICNYTFFACFTLLCVYPFYYLFINTISSNELSAAGSINFLPRQIHFSNFVEVFKIKGLLQATIISILRTSIGMVCTVLASAFLGFLFTQQNLPGRKFWYRYTIITMYFSAGLIPIFLTIRTLGLINNFMVYIIPLMVQPFNIILVKTYIESTPSALQEAARIDGAHFFTIFYKIILPLSTPILATIAVFAAVGQWNSFQDTLLYITDSSLYTLQYILQQTINQANSIADLIKNSAGGNAAQYAVLATRQTPTSVRMTVSIIVVLPILLVYPFFQKYFVKGIMIGSVKE